MYKYLIVFLIMFVVGCSEVYRPPIVGPRDPLLLIDCATPWDVEKLEKSCLVILEQKGIKL